MKEKYFTLKNVYGYIRRVLDFKKPFQVYYKMDRIGSRDERKMIRSEADTHKTLRAAKSNGYINLYVVMVDDDVATKKHEGTTCKGGKQYSRFPYTHKRRVTT